MKHLFLTLTLSLLACFIIGCDTGDYAQKGAASSEGEHVSKFGCNTDGECLHNYKKRDAVKEND